MRLTGMRALALLLFAALAVVGACGDGESSGRGTQSVTVGQALDRRGEVTVRGALFVERDGAHLCEAVMESYPPQCGGRALTVQGLDLASLDLEEPNEPGFAPVRWSHRQVTLTGRVEGDVLRDARVSD